MGSQRIDYNHTKTWTITLNNAIGPTATLRTLDNASPTDVNAIWLAPNGSDVAAGTAAAPVLTLEKAIDLLQAGSPTVTTIHIIRNSYVGNISFVMSNDHATGDELPVGTIIQTELGTVATISLDGLIGDVTNPISGLKLNGIYFTLDEGSADTIIYAEGNLSIKWCELKETNGRTTVLNHVSGVSITRDLSNSIFDANGKAIDRFILLSAVSVTSTMENNIYKNLTLGTGGLNDSMIFVNGPSITIGHSVFYNCITAIRAGLTPSTATITNSIFSNISDPLDFVDANGVINLSYSLLTNPTIDSQVTQGVQIQFGILPAFFDQLNDDFRLMDQRRTAPNSTENFVFTSKGVYNLDIGQTPGDDTRDLGPFDVSYVLSTDTWLSFEMDDEYWNADVNFTYELINSHTYKDVRGNFRRSFDGNRRSVNLQMKSMNFTGNEDSYKIKDIIMSEGSKKYYPQGDTGIWNDTGALVENADGDFDVTLSAISDLTRNAYEGFVATAASGALEFELRIKSNASGSLVLEDHRGNQSGVVDDTYNIICSYLPVEVDQQSTPQVFSDWSASLNPLRETAAGEYEQQEGHVRSLRLRETEEDE